jgi:hypothetical protein
MGTPPSTAGCISCAERRSADAKQLRPARQCASLRGSAPGLGSQSLLRTTSTFGKGRQHVLHASGLTSSNPETLDLPVHSRVHHPRCLFQPTHLASPARPTATSAESQLCPQSVYAASPLDLNMDVDSLKDMTDVAPRRSRRKPPMPHSAGPIACGVRQSPIVKAQRRRSAHLSTIIPPREVNNVLIEAQNQSQAQVSRTPSVEYMPPNPYRPRPYPMQSWVLLRCLSRYTTPQPYSLRITLRLLRLQSTLTQYHVLLAPPLLLL